VYARPTPTGTYRWFFPRGARLAITERRGGQYRVQLDAGTAAWIDTTAVRVGAEGAAAPAPAAANARLVDAPEGPQLLVAGDHAPFLVEAEGSRLHVTVYGARPGTLNAPAGPVVTAATQATVAEGTQRFTLQLARPAWGYRASYRPDGALAVQVRRPPQIDAANPLRGIRVVIDPGHPPAGAVGPTGLREAEANLAIALPLAERLRARGAEVILTRTENVPVGLAERTQLAVQRNADILVSVHNNAFGEAANPFRAHGTSTYYFHPFSADLARALNRELVGVTRLPDLGALQSNLALVRPTWMPTALTESVFMPIPEQEAALRDPGFVSRLADAHVRGLEEFLRQRAGQ
jgi:N-acetylmuramoyl-L-alanine amidase